MWKLSSLSYLSLLFLVVFLLCTTTTTVVYGIPLDDESVILITGAAGFIGSELAMALHRVYQPKKILCIDTMDTQLRLPNQKKSDQDLALFEFKRQRIFHLLQTVDADRIYFYRADFRPSIPEFFDSSEVPVLHHIFQEHTDITHIVHLADHIHRGMVTEFDDNIQIVPRIKGEHEKSGMIEGLLEETLLHRDTTGITPTFLFASSSGVYNQYVANTNNPNPPPFKENKPITTPTTTEGASKLLDELITQAYYDTYNLPSIGIRLFDIYGPWGLPGSAVFEMSEKVVAGEDPIKAVIDADSIADYTYIDDAIDAILAALQFPASKPLVFNVGTGKGTSLRDIASLMRELVPEVTTQPDDVAPPSPAKKVSYADLDRSNKYLGYMPRVSLQEGIETTLAWHYDRAYPYGSGADASSSIGSKGIVRCSKYDSECLRGTPIFPCASECSHPENCKRSLYDDILELTRAVTAKCNTVLYTVSLNNTIQEIPSTNVRVSSQSVAYVDVDIPGVHCNLAFVSKDSPLYTSSSALSSTDDGIVKHGFWSLIPVAVTNYAEDKINLLSLLPKLSPGQFFSDAVKKAIYTDPNVVIDNLPRLIEESNMQPAHSSVPGATTILVGKKEIDPTTLEHPVLATTRQIPPKELVQDMAYRTIRMAVIDEMKGDGFAQKVDSSFMVHTLNSENDDDGRLFRCDVFGEVVQWQVETDSAALEFILSLHDMWSRVMVQQSGMEPWWIGDDVTTVSGATLKRGRRLQQVHGPNHRKLEEDIEDGEEEEDELAADLAESGTTGKLEQEHNGFGDVIGAMEAVFGYGSKREQQKRFDRPDEEIDNNQEDDFVVDDDDTAEIKSAFDGDDEQQQEEDPDYYLNNSNQDPSSYDVWMGVLSSTSVRYFSRIVSMDAVGVYKVTESSVKSEQQQSQS